MDLFTYTINNRYLTVFKSEYSGVPNRSAARLLDFGKLFLTYTIIRYYITISKSPTHLLNFGKLSLPTQLLRPTLILGTRE